MFFQVVQGESRVQDQVLENRNRSNSYLVTFSAGTWVNRSSHPWVFQRKGVLPNFVNSLEKTCFLAKLLQRATLLWKGPTYRYFTRSFTKFQGATFLQNTSWSLLLSAWYLTLREKCPNTKFFLVRIFPHSDWIRRDTSHFSVFSPNAGRYGPEKTPYLDTFHTVSVFKNDWRTHSNLRLKTLKKMEAPKKTKNLVVLIR